MLVFFFVALPLAYVSPGLGGLFWVIAIIMLLVGVAGRKKEIAEERIRRRGELEEEGRQRVRQEGIGVAQPIVKETVITREVVLIKCGSRGARYPQGTTKCLTCGANL